MTWLETRRYTPEEVASVVTLFARAELDREPIDEDSEPPLPDNDPVPDDGPKDGEAQ